MVSSTVPRFALVSVFVTYLTFTVAMAFVAPPPPTHPHPLPHHPPADPHATAHVAPEHPLPAPKCYTKSKKCCFVFAVCKHVSKTVHLKPRCDFNHCAPKCTPVCKDVTKQVPKKVCGHHGCHVTYIAFHNKVCHDHCKDECKWVKAICPKTQTFVTPKFCAELKCEEEKVEGSTEKPEDIVGSGAKLAGTVAGPRQIIHDGH